MDKNGQNTTLEQPMPDKIRTELTASVIAEPHEWRSQLPTDREISALIALARPRERALIGLLAFAGLTTSEVAALRRSDLSLDPPSLVRIRRGKFGRAREIELDSRVAQWLRLYLESIPELTAEAPIFPGRSGALTPRSVQHNVERLSITSPGGRVTPRHLRLACIHRWLRTGVPLEKMRQRLGVDTLQFLEPLDAEMQEQRRRRPPGLTRRRRPGRPRVMTERDAELHRMVREDELSYAQAATQYAHRYQLARPLSSEAVRKAVNRYKP